MNARAGVPGSLQEREGSMGERMGLLEDHARWTMEGAVFCVGSMA